MDSKWQIYDPMNFKTFSFMCPFHVRMWGYETLQIFCRTVWFGPWYHHKCIDCVQSSFVEVCNLFAFVNIWVVCGQFSPGSEQNADSHHKVLSEKKVESHRQGLLMCSRCLMFRPVQQCSVWFEQYVASCNMTDILFMN